MPVPFTDEEQKQIRQKLKEAAYHYVKEYSVQKITVGQLTTDAGISKGAFYKFYPSKEHLFYELLRELHEKVYGPAIALLLEDSDILPEQKICNAIIAGCDALDESAMERFWTTDALEIMKHISVDEQMPQKSVEKELFSAFWKRNGTLKVSEEQANDAIRTLLATTGMKKTLGERYRDVLYWMAEGVCRRVFE